MSLEQKRIRDLPTFVILDPSDPDYIPIEELIFAVDHASFERAKGLSQQSFAALILHQEYDRITGLTSRNLSVSFDTSFTSIPSGEVRVYRMHEYPIGWQRKDVLWAYADANQPTMVGFSIVIADTEDLTGVIVEYDFK